MPPAPLKNDPILFLNPIFPHETAPKTPEPLLPPRTPWGTRLTGRTFHDHMRASEDDGQSYLDRNGVPPALSGQITPERAAEMNDPSPKLPALTPAPSQSPQPEDRTNATPRQLLQGQLEDPASSNGYGDHPYYIQPSPEKQGGFFGSGKIKGLKDFEFKAGWSSNRRVQEDQEAYEKKYPSKNEPKE